MAQIKHSTLAVAGELIVGKPFLLTINAKDAVDFYAINAYLDYSPSEIVCDIVDGKVVYQPGDLFAGADFSISLVDNQQGRVNIGVTLEGDVKGKSGFGKVVSIKMTPMKPGIITLTFGSDSEAFSSELVDMELKKLQAIFQSSSFTAVVETTAGLIIFLSVEPI
jgi:hypothetical protein